MKQRRLLQDNRGSHYLEFLVVLPALMLVAVFVYVSFWVWWNQSVATVAIHQGTAWAARKDGSLERGEQETLEMLAIGLGRSALAYEDRYHIVYLEPMRAAAGYIWLPMDAPLGFGHFDIRANAFHRKEQFYGGPYYEQGDIFE